ncbi:hypothetical protein QBC98_007044 [Kitasatospora acidiphila]
MNSCPESLSATSGARPRLTAQIGAVVRELAGRAGARVLSALAVFVSRHVALRVLLRLPLPKPRTPRVLGVDDFTLRRRRRYATVLIDAETRERIDVLPDSQADTLEAWLREHSGVKVVCRDGSAAYAGAIRRALPDTVQVADRWHVWHNLAEAVFREVAAHSTCWAKAGPPPQASHHAGTGDHRRRQRRGRSDRGAARVACEPATVQGTGLR